MPKPSTGAAECGQATRRAVRSGSAGGGGSRCSACSHVPAHAHSHYQDSIPNGRNVAGVPGGRHGVGHIAPNPASHTGTTRGAAVYFPAGGADLMSTGFVNRRRILGRPWRTA